MAKYANQNKVKIHKGSVLSCGEPYLALTIKDINEARRNLTSAGFAVYLYLAENADLYDYAFSPAHLKQEMGLCENSARAGFEKLIEKRYITKDINGKLHFYTSPQEETFTEEEFYNIIPRRLIQGKEYTYSKLLNSFLEHGYTEHDAKETWESGEVIK